MLQINLAQLNEIYRHGALAFPHECCGILLGTSTGSRRVVRRVYRARNIHTDRAHDRYELDPADRMRAEEAARGAGLDLVGFYHSHPDHAAYFSQTDLERSEEYQLGEPWLEPAYSYLVASIQAGRGADVKSFIVIEGRSEEEPVEISEQ